MKNLILLFVACALFSCVYPKPDPWCQSRDWTRCYDQKDIADKEGCDSKEER